MLELIKKIGMGILLGIGTILFVGLGIGFIVGCSLIGLALAKISVWLGVAFSASLIILGVVLAYVFK